MRLQLMTAIAILGLPMTSALSAEPVPPGTTTTIDLRMTVKDQVKGEWHSAVIEHVFNGQCVMKASQASSVGPDGMTPEQEAQAAAMQNQAQDVYQEYAPSDDTMAEIMAGAEACGDDEACMMQMAIKLSQTPEMQAMAAKTPEAKAAIAGLKTDLGPVRYQFWEPLSCDGTITVNDTYIDSDPGGEGGDGAYTDTITANGTAPLMPDWRGVVMYTDVVANQTTYQIGTPPPVSVPANSSMSGAHQRQVEFLSGERLPERIGPIGGVLTSQSQQINTKGGTVTLEVAPK